MGKTFISASETIAIYPLFKRWSSYFRQMLHPAKNRVSILLPVSARDRAKPRHGQSQWEKHSSAPQSQLQFFLSLSASRLNPGRRYVQHKTACQFCLRFPLGIAPNPDTAKVIGNNIHQRLRDNCKFSTFQALVVFVQTDATSSKKPRGNTTSGFRSGSRQSPTRPKSIGKTFISASEAIAIYTLFKRWSS